MHGVAPRATRQVVLGLLGSVVLALVGATPFAAAAAPPHVLYVSPSGTAEGPGTAAAPYQTIAEAVAAAPVGAVIRVMPGTYDVTAPIVLSQSVTVTAVAGNAASGRTVITGQAPIFELANGSSGVTGITIRDLTFRNITDPTGNANGVITTPGYGAGDVSIVGNRFVNTATQAIGDHGNAGLAAPLNTHWLIANNRIQGVTGAGQSGMFLGNLADSAVINNTVVNTAWAGIIVTAAGSGAYTSQLLIAGNVVKDVPHEGIQVAYGQNVRVIHNRITGAGEDGPSAPTVSMDAAISLFNTNQSGITVAYNDLVHNYQGVELGQPSVAASRVALGANVAVNDNNLVDNMAGDVVNNAASGTLNAVDNWWGSRMGPAAGDAVGAVLDTPFLTRPLGMGQQGVGRGVAGDQNGQGRGHGVGRAHGHARPGATHAGVRHGR